MGDVATNIEAAVIPATREPAEQPTVHTRPLLRQCQQAFTIWEFLNANYKNQVESPPTENVHYSAHDLTSTIHYAYTIDVPGSERQYHVALIQNRQGNHSGNGPTHIAVVEPVITLTEGDKVIQTLRFTLPADVVHTSRNALSRKTSLKMVDFAGMSFFLGEEPKRSLEHSQPVWQEGLYRGEPKRNGVTVLSLSEDLRTVGRNTLDEVMDLIGMRSKESSQEKKDSVSMESGSPSDKLDSVFQECQEAYRLWGILESGYGNNALPDEHTLSTDPTVLYQHIVSVPDSQTRKRYHVGFQEMKTPKGKVFKQIITITEGYEEKIVRSFHFTLPEEAEGAWRDRLRTIGEQSDFFGVSMYVGGEVKAGTLTARRLYKEGMSTEGKVYETPSNSEGENIDVSVATRSVLDELKSILGPTIVR